MFNQPGFQPDKITSNFSANSPSWGKIDKGTLVIKPEYANKSLDEMLKDADLAFSVQAVETGYWFNNTYMLSDAYSIVRSDTGREMGKGFTDGYFPKSYHEILSDIFEDTKNLGGIPTRLISFDKGARASIQFVMPDEYYVAGRAHNTFFNVFASHNGKVGVTANSADTCIVCGNTNARALADKTLKTSFKHTASVGEKLAGLRNLFTFILDDNKEYYPFLNKAATIQIESKEVEQFLYMMIPDGKSENAGPSNRRDELQEAINMTLLESNKPADDVSAYDLFQGALRYTSYRTQKRNQDEQYDYVLNGPGARLNEVAYNWLKEVTN